MVFIRKNFAQGLLAEDISDVAVQITLQAGHTLPTEAGSFRLVIWDNVTYLDPADDPTLEIVTASYTGTPNKYDIVRAKEDTVATSHNTSDRVALHYTAGLSEADLSVVGDAEVDDTAIAADKILVVYNNAGVLDLRYEDPEVQISDLHNAVTLGVANGLSLAGQEISLALADTNTIGALSDTDWNTFNNKADYSFGANNFSGTGDFTTDGTGTFNNITASSFNSAGFVKNNASGVLSGGNSIVVSDITDISTTYLQIDGSNANSNIDIGSYNFTTTGKGTFDKVNVNSTGNTNTRLAVGTADIASGYKGLVEIGSNEANPISNTESSALTVNSVFDGSASQSSHYGFAGAFFLSPKSTVAGDIAANNWVGLYGGANADINFEQSGFLARSITIQGLQFSASNREDWTAGGGFTNSVISTYGMSVSGTLGYADKTISGSKAEAKNYGAHINGALAGYYNADNAGTNYGAYVKTSSTLQDATGDITSYALYIDALTGGVESSGGTVTSWGLYEANGIDNALAGNTRIGGTSAPTVALDVTGAAKISTNVEIDGALNHDGSTVGFYGTAPVAQNQLATGSTVDDVITELQRLGLVRQAA